jgi:hypothetical protein
MPLGLFRSKKERQSSKKEDGNAKNETPNTKTKKEKEHEDEEDVERKAWCYIRYILIAGILFVLLISLCCKRGTECGPVLDFISTFGRGLLIGGAAFACGGFGGFIFGIPSMVQNEETQKQLRLKYNDNLIQISDWLTKIIVGVGLIQLTKIPGKISDLGDNLKTNFGSVDWAKIASLSIVFYFFLLGFLIFYFWTRTDFTKIIVKTNEELDMVQALKKNLEAQKQTLQVQTQKLESQSEKIEDLMDSETAKVNKELIDRSKVAFDAASTGSIDGDEAMKKAVDDLKQKVKQTLQAKPPYGTDKEDLQKNRWGGKPVVGTKKISATVVPSAARKSYYDITFTITDTAAPKHSPVAVFVHPSFNLPDNVIYLKPDTTGITRFVLTAYEAFTVGALFPDGTELELDLNNLPGNPEGFNWGEDEGKKATALF